MPSHRPAPSAFSDLLRRAGSLALLPLLLGFYLAALGTVPLFEPDEGRYAEIPREMLATGDFVTPHLDGVVYLEKPPLFYWLTAASEDVLGVTELGARFWSAALAVLGVLFVAWATRRVLGPGAGLAAGAVLATSPLYLVMGHTSSTDMTLSFFLTATLLCAFFAVEADAPGEARWWWRGVFAGAALALLTKGLVAVALPGGIILVYLAWTRRLKELARVPWVSGVLLFLAIGLPWHLLASAANPDFFDFYIVREHFLRFLTPEAERPGPIWYFLPILLVGLAPWTALAFAALPRFRRSDLRRPHTPEHRFLAFMALWAVLITAFFSVSHSKLPSYVLPVVAPLAVLAAAGLDDLLEGRRRVTLLDRLLTGAVALLTAALGAGFVWAALGRLPKALNIDRLTPSLAVTGAIALLAALLAAGAWFAGRPRPGGPLLSAAAVGLTASILVSAGPLGQARSTREIATFLRGHGQAEATIFSYRTYTQTLPVYLQRLIGVVASTGELSFGIGKLPPEVRRQRFPDAAEFAPVWRSAEPVFVVTERRYLPHMAGDGLDGGTTLVEGPRYVLLGNPPAAAAVR